MYGAVMFFVAPREDDEEEEKKDADVKTLNRLDSLHSMKHLSMKARVNNVCDFFFFFFFFFFPFSSFSSFYYLFTLFFPPSILLKKKKKIQERNMDMAKVTEAVGKMEAGKFTNAKNYDLANETNPLMISGGRNSVRSISRLKGMMILDQLKQQQKQASEEKKAKVYFFFFFFFFFLIIIFVLFFCLFVFVCFQVNIILFTSISSYF